VLFLFGWINAGVHASHIGNGTWIVLIALVAGPLGIVTATLIGEPLEPGCPPR